MPHSISYPILPLIGRGYHPLHYKQHHYLLQLLEALYLGILFHVSIPWRCKSNPLHHLLYKAIRSTLCSRRKTHNTKNSKFLRLPLSIFTTGFLPLPSQDLIESLRRPLAEALMNLLTSRTPPLTCVPNTPTRPKSVRQTRTKLQIRHPNLASAHRPEEDRGLIPTHGMIVHSTTMLLTRPAVPIVGNVIKACPRPTAAVSARALHDRSHVRRIRLGRIKDDGGADHRSGRGRGARDGSFPF